MCHLGKCPAGKGAKESRRMRAASGHPQDLTEPGARGGASARNLRHLPAHSEPAQVAYDTGYKANAVKSSPPCLGSHD